MKILIIGNGFDLAHGLSTKYTDFLDRAKEFLEYHNRNDMLPQYHLGEQFGDALRQIDLYNEFCEVDGNIWSVFCTIVAKFRADAI